MKRRCFMLVNILLAFGMLLSSCNPDDNPITSDVTVPNPETEQPDGSDENMTEKTEQKIRITIGNQTATAIIYNNPTAHSLIGQLPLTIDMDDFAGSEKIFYLPQNPIIDDASRGLRTSMGDIAVYAPWGNFAVFYRDGDGSTSNDLIPIGRVENGIELFQVNGSLNDVHIELIKEQSDNEQDNTAINRNIMIQIGDETFELTLEDSPAARAFAALLPMTVTMTEMNGNEKYYNLSANLPADTFRPGTIHTGDLLLWGANTVVLFYETFSSAYSYTRLGKIDNPEGLAAALGRGNVKVTFSLH